MRISTPPGVFAEQFNLELENPPEGIVLQSVELVTGGVELVISCDSKKMKAGAAGNLICDVLQITQGAAQKKAGNQPRRGVAATLPAIPFQITAE